ncbi:MAG: hypothetical protein DI533_14720 [Cereibacter sphaeroides]|uniref:Translation initiation factor 2 n=1 Tax=Cereibacter sphaeroides TaxID=1063 RepID=A0A2W5TM74_CERSP|nr:MAG: hypothetical protein DI533_14720 [Cereibacter sphaeroides]
MKPSFALNFTDDSIGLLHRTSRGWLEVGAVPLDEPDLGRAVAYLRGSALGLEPRGVTTKLVIPNSQVRYLTLKAPGPDATSRRAQIKAELEGRTPYAVEDLVFDWWGKGSAVQVAVVARETLEEAEAFATENRLNPVSFVAIPEPGEFGAEPWFGPTALAATLLQPGEKVDRDQDPVQVVGRAPKADFTEPTPIAEQDADKAAPEPEAGIGLPVEAVLEPVISVLEPALAPEPKAIAEPRVAAPAKPPLSEKPAQHDEVKETLAVAPPPDSLPESRPQQAPELPTPEVVVEAPAATQPASEKTANLLVEDPLDDIPPPRPSVLPPPPLRATPTNALPRKPVATAPHPAAKAIVQPPQAPKRNLPPAPSRLSPVPGGGGDRGAKLAVPVPEAEWPLERVTNAARMAQGKGEAARASVVTAPSIPIQRERRLSVVPPAAEDRSEGTAAASRAAQQPSTVFGTPPVRQRGKPRFLGLILTLILLGILAAVFVWSSIFLASSGDGEAPAVAATSSEQAETVASMEEPEAALPDASAQEVALGPTDQIETSADDEMLADGQDPELLGSEAFDSPDLALDVEPIVAEGAVVEAAPIEVAAEPEAAVESAIFAQPDTSDTPSPNPSDEPQDEIFLAMVDPAVATSDAVALTPPIANTDSAPLSQGAPPPFGTLYQFDASGLIIPTPEGVITPDGVRLVAGPPPRIPPERPAALAEPAEASTAAAADPVATAGAATVAEPAPLPSDPALANARPRLRPAELMPPATAESDDDASLGGGEPAVRVSSLKPRARPAEIIANGEAQLAAADAAMTAATSAAVQAASASLVVSADPSNSQLAIAVSRKPAPRPKDFSPAIEAAVSAAAADATLSIASPPAAQPAAAEPEIKLASLSPSEDARNAEVDEPEVTKSAPSIPTKASVAKQATFKNAINLGKTNLIGVYGTSANRYAMVRNDNGRFVKVEVGDRIDGGRVAAISDRELSYIKNGQTVTLKLPKG